MTGCTCTHRCDNLLMLVINIAKQAPRTRKNLQYQNFIRISQMVHVMTQHINPDTHTSLRVAVSVPLLYEPASGDERGKGNSVRHCPNLPEFGPRRHLTSSHKDICCNHLQTEVKLKVQSIHSFCSLSYDRSVAPSKASSPQGAI
jgi:hypothetical protein